MCIRRAQRLNARRDKGTRNSARTGAAASCLSQVRNNNRSSGNGPVIYKLGRELMLFSRPDVGPLNRVMSAMPRGSWSLCGVRGCDAFIGFFAVSVAREVAKLRDALCIGCEKFSLQGCAGLLQSIVKSERKLMSREHFRIIFL